MKDPNSIPTSWESVRIGDLCSLDNGRGFKSSEWSRKGKPIIRIQNLNNPDATFNYFEGEIPEKFHVKKGDLLFAWSGTPGTSFGAHEWKRGDAFLNQHIFNVRFPRHLIDKVYFRVAFNQQLHQLIEGAHGGVGLRHVTKRKLNDTKIPLPPLNEQKRIVAKFEELFSELDAGVASLNQARTHLSIYRQSILKQAFEGKLTAKWRRDHPEKIESPKKLINLIRLERETRYQFTLQAWQTAIKDWDARGKDGKKPPKPRKLNEIEPLSPDVIKNLPGIPAEWTWQPMKGLSIEISDGPFGSNLKTSDYVNSGVRVIRLENIGVGKFIKEKKSFITREKYETLKKHTLLPGNLVFASFVTEKVRSAIVPPDFEVSVNKADCFRISLYGDSIDRRFLNFCFGARYFFKHLESLIHGVGRPRVNTTQLGDAPFPLCSLPEQREIVRLLEEQFTTIGQNDREIETSLRRAKALRQSILTRAFSGRLVPQDPADEPAESLFKRIQKQLAAEALKNPKKKATRIPRPKVDKMKSLLEVLKGQSDWIDSQNLFELAGIANGSSTREIEKLYNELRLNLEKLQIERRGTQDWIKLKSKKGETNAS